MKRYEWYQYLLVLSEITINGCNINLYFKYLYEDTFVCDVFDSISVMISHINVFISEYNNKRLQEKSVLKITVLQVRYL